MRSTYAQVAANSPLESARLFIAIATVALILFQGPKGQGKATLMQYSSRVLRFLFFFFFLSDEVIYSCFDIARVD